jgi:hypothetical protein
LRRRRFDWLGRGALDYSRPLLFGDQILGLTLIEIREGKIVSFAQTIGKGLNPG